MLLVSPGDAMINLILKPRNSIQMLRVAHNGFRGFVDSQGHVWENSLQQQEIANKSAFLHGIIKSLARCAKGPSRLRYFTTVCQLFTVVILKVVLLTTSKCYKRGFGFYPLPLLYFFALLFRSFMSLSVYVQFYLVAARNTKESTHLQDVCGGR